MPRRAIEILEDRWNAPEGTDQPTLTLFKEMSHIWQLMKDGEVDIVITEEDFRHYWRRATVPLIEVDTPENFISEVMAYSCSP